MRERRLSLALAVFGLLLALTAEAQEAEETRVGSIDVESENVFGPAYASNSDGGQRAIARLRGAQRHVRRRRSGSREPTGADSFG